MTFISLYLCFEHDLRANAFRVCREGKPVPTFSDQALVQGVRDLVIEMTGLVVAAKLAQRCLVQVKKNIVQRVGWGITGGKALPVNLAQRADGGGAVLVADFTILLAVVETCLTHAALPCADVETSTRRGEMAILHCNHGLDRACRTGLL